MAEKYELFIGKNKQGRDKKYLVFDHRVKVTAVHACCKKFFHCAGWNVCIEDAYVWKDNLYLLNPAIPGAKLVTVAYYVA